ncbi:hypothetical protein V3C99_016138 [Haemonchus contortus]
MGEVKKGRCLHQNVDGAHSTDFHFRQCCLPRSGNSSTRRDRKSVQDSEHAIQQSSDMEQRLGKQSVGVMNSRRTVTADVIAKGKEYFSEADYRSLEEKLLSILKPRFEKRKKEIANLPKCSVCECNFTVNPKIEDLPEGTVYGCNGVMNTMGKKKDFIYTACLYKRP